MSALIPRSLHLFIPRPWCSPETILVAGVVSGYPLAHCLAFGEPIPCVFHKKHGDSRATGRPRVCIL